MRTLAELQTVYHSTVGQNAFLELDFAPTPEGLIAADQAARYKEFGDWIRTCYEGVGVMGKVEHPLGKSPGSNTQLLTFGRQAVVIDRVVVREDQTEGQVIRAWEVHARRHTVCCVQNIHEACSSSAFYTRGELADFLWCW